MFKDYKINVVNITLGLILLSLTALLQYYFFHTISNDFKSYLISLSLISSHTFFESYEVLRYEIGSLFILWWLNSYFSDANSIYLTGLIAVIIKYFIFQKYLIYPKIAFFFYIITFMHIVDANQIRLALALCIVFYALFKDPKSNYTYLFLAIFATFFHYSGIIILSLYFIRTKYFLMLGGIILGLSFKTLVQNVSFLNFAEIWTTETTNAVNLTNSLFIMQACISVICFFEWNNLSEGQKRGALFSAFGVIIYLAFMHNPIVAHRIRELCQMGIFAIIFLGEHKLSRVKFFCSICGVYIIVYNLFMILSELNTIS